jgi:hypothetical protein
MRKLILGLLRLLITASLFLSGCGLRPCLHTTTGCQTDNSERTNRAGSSAAQRLVANRALTALPGLSDRPRTVQPAGNTS